MVLGSGGILEMKCEVFGEVYQASSRAELKLARVTNDTFNVSLIPNTNYTVVVSCFNECKIIFQSLIPKSIWVSSIPFKFRV